MEDWLDASFLEQLVTGVVAFDEVLGTTTFDWFGKDGVGVEVVEDKNVIHASTGMEWEPSREIGAYGALEVFELEYGDADLMSSIDVAPRQLKGKVFEAWWLFYYFRCRSDTLSHSLLAAHDG